MRVAVIDVKNNLLAEGIVNCLLQRGDFKPERVVDSKKLTETCLTLKAEVMLLEVSRAEDCSFDKRLTIIKDIRSKNKTVKIALLVDENTDKENAEKCKNAKKEKIVDEFFYTTVSGDYLAACLDSL